MTDFGPQEKIWLIKSAGKILGPYSFDEMKFLLERRKVSILDEIRHPKRIWSLIRENEAFAQIVEDLRDQEATQIDNTTELDSLRTRTLTGDADDRTPAPQQAPVQMLTPLQTVALQKAEGSQPEFSMGQRRQIAEPPKPKVSIGMTPVMVISFLILCFAAYHLFENKWSLTKTLSYNELIALGESSQMSGDFELSINFFNRANQVKELPAATLVQLAAMMVEVGSQIPEAQQLLQVAISKLDSVDPVRVKANVALGLSYAKTNNFVKAEEIDQSILFADENQNEARVNLATTKLMRGDYKGALKEYTSSLRKGGNEGLAILGKAISGVGVSEGPADASRLRAIIEDLDRYVNGNLEYRLEALLIKAVVLQKLGDREGSMKTGKVLLDEDPTLTGLHIHNIYMDRQFLSWDRLNSMYCDFLNVKWSENQVALGVSAFCIAEKMDFVSANIKLDEAMKRFPNSSLLMGSQAYILNRLKRLQESEQIASKVESESILAQRVLAMDCEESQNWDCADQKWRRIMLGNAQGQDLGAIYGMAKFQLHRSHRDQVKDLIKKGLDISKNYRPLLEMRERLHAQ